MKKLVEDLRPSLPIRKFLESNETWAQTRAQQLGIVTKYITTQALLHLPYHSPEAITATSPDVLHDIDAKVINLGEDYSNAYKMLYGKT